ncbi:MAG TPA: radical SAM protein [Candidatus Saccharimonadales bacterium]|nr:radical SAM protein [Candidatus Saccharimonadales bacterium]
MTTINLAIGPNCPVRCEGCYNYFAENPEEPLITADEITDFAAKAKEYGVSKATLSGGDPLFHPEIVAIARGIKGAGLEVKLDTVGTSFLDDVPILYKGRGLAPKVDVSSLKPHVDLVSIPLDGANQTTISRFRRGRHNLFAETLAVAGLLQKTGVSFGYNTVAHASNLSELPAIQRIAEDTGAKEWQIFEFDPNGPNPTSKKDLLRLAPGQFASETNMLKPVSGILMIVRKSLLDRSDAYFLIDSTGLAWQPTQEGARRVFGHISRDSDVVMSALKSHMSRVKDRQSTWRPINF